MTTPNKYSPANKLPLPPRCPHCAADLAEVGTFQWTKQLGVGLAVMLSLYCPNSECRKLLATQIFIVPQPEESAIARPH